MAAEETADFGGLKCFSLYKSATMKFRLKELRPVHWKLANGVFLPSVC